MATAPESPNATKITPRKNTVVTISVLLGMLIIIIALACLASKKRRPELEPTPLRYRQDIEEQSKTGAPNSFVVDSMPRVKYETVTRGAQIVDETDDGANTNTWLGGRENIGTSIKSECASLLRRQLALTVCRGMPYLRRSLRSDGGGTFVALRPHIPCALHRSVAFESRWYLSYMVDALQLNQTCRAGL